MKKIKRMGISALSAALILSMCGCGGSGTPESRLSDEEGTINEQSGEGDTVSEQTDREGTESGQTDREGTESSTPSGDGSSWKGQQETPVYVTQSGLAVEPGKTVNLSEHVSSKNVDQSGIKEDQITSITDSALRLFYADLEKEPEKNVLISPVSILFALGMTENGADGNTLTEMEQVLSGGIGVQELNPVMYSLNQKLSAAQDVSWNVADSIWVKNDGSVTLREQFVTDAVSYYDADIVMAPFDQTTVADINGWVNENTHEMIPSIINDISPDDRMYLINAMAFEGDWAEEYEETQVREGMEFLNADGSTSEVTMLRSEESEYFYLGDGVGFKKDYKGGEYSFIGILPPEDQTVDEYMAAIVSGKGKNNSLSYAVTHTKKDVPVYVGIPEFTLDYDTQMSGLLTELGMPSAFSGDADFRKMVSEDSDPLHIGSVLHKTHIEVDRKGTRAAAVTAVVMQTNGIMTGPEPVNVVLDRPFVYGIVDNETGLPIFLGCVNFME